MDFGEEQANKHTDYCTAVFDCCLGTITNRRHTHTQSNQTFDLCLKTSAHSSLGVSCCSFNITGMQPKTVNSVNLRSRWMYNNRPCFKVTAKRVSSPKCLKNFFASWDRKCLGLHHCILFSGFLCAGAFMGPSKCMKRMWGCDWLTSRCYTGSIDKANAANLMSLKRNSTLRPSKKFYGFLHDKLLCLLLFTMC